MLTVITHLIAFAVGVLCVGSYAGFKISKRQAPGTVSRDFAAPGMPYAGIIDAEVIETAVRGD
ncbi:hypothetical protein [Pseudaminobacter sp. NGMCC 1.201702]|uniref:hypothetical protein n=1 Tax=Pseudaminobacter sp. NGMCC 1.201702 TaxID=3391825 RepID=UPI0039F0D330